MVSIFLNPLILMPLEVRISYLVFPLLEKNILKGLNLEFGSLFCLFKSRLIYFCVCANMSIFFTLHYCISQNSGCADGVVTFLSVL